MTATTEPTRTESSATLRNQLAEIDELISRLERARKIADEFAPQMARTLADEIAFARAFKKLLGRGGQA
jgi:hypothetical protein